MRMQSTHALYAGALAALLGFGMSAGQAQAFGWPEPNIPCAEANTGELYVLQHNTRWQRLEITYYCDGTAWQLSQVCDLSPGGICVLY